MYSRLVITSVELQTIANTKGIAFSAKNAKIKRLVEEVHHYNDSGTSIINMHYEINGLLASSLKNSCSYSIDIVYLTVIPKCFGLH